MPMIPLAFGWPPGPWELVIIVVILLLVFGRRLPEIMRNVGRGLTQFKRGMHDVVDDVKQDVQSDAPPAPKKDEDKPAG